MACWLKFRASKADQKVASLILTAVNIVLLNKMLNSGLLQQGDSPVISTTIGRRQKLTYGAVTFTIAQRNPDILIEIGTMDILMDWRMKKKFPYTFKVDTQICSTHSGDDCSASFV